MKSSFGTKRLNREVGQGQEGGEVLDVLPVIPAKNQARSQGSLKNANDRNTR